jgi:hypothetical protein
MAGRRISLSGRRFLTRTAHSAGWPDRSLAAKGWLVLKPDAADIASARERRFLPQAPRGPLPSAAIEALVELVCRLSLPLLALARHMIK